MYTSKFPNKKYTLLKRPHAEVAVTILIQKNKISK